MLFSLRDFSGFLHPTGWDALYAQKYIAITNVQVDSVGTGTFTVSWMTGRGTWSQVKICTGEGTIVSTASLTTCFDPVTRDSLTFTYTLTPTGLTDTVKTFSWALQLDNDDASWTSIRQVELVARQIQPPAPL